MNALDEYESVHWGILLPGDHFEQYDDEEDAREHLVYYRSGSVAYRKVVYGPVVTVQ